MTETRIAELESKGFKRWTKGNYDRLYINATSLGLVLSFYKTGNISSAEWNGEKISNSKAYKLRAAKTYIDVKTGEITSDYDELKEAAQEILDSTEEAAQEILDSTEEVTEEATEEATQDSEEDVMTVKFVSEGMPVNITASRSMLNYISILASEASKAMASEGSVSIASQAKDVADQIYYILKESGLYQ